MSPTTVRRLGVLALVLVAVGLLAAVCREVTAPTVEPTMTPIVPIVVITTAPAPTATAAPATTTPAPDPVLRPSATATAAPPTPTPTVPASPPAVPTMVQRG